jgi:hypothetical protein
MTPAVRLRWLFSSLPATSWEVSAILRAVSVRNVELVELMIQAFRSGSRGAAFDVDLIEMGPLDPEVEWDPTEVAETFGIPDINQIYVGIEGGKAFWREWLSAWEAVEFDYELLDAGEQVVALIDQRMKGRVTGISFDLGSYAQTFTFRDGLLTRWKCFGKQEDALAAAGLSA